MLFDASLGNLPDLPILETPVRPILDMATADPDISAVVTAAYFYQRKGNVSFDAVQGERNPAYGREGDDILVQINVYVKPNTELYSHIAAAGELAKKVEAEERREAARLQLAAVKEEEKRLLAIIEGV